MGRRRLWLIGVFVMVGHSRSCKFTVVVYRILLGEEPNTDMLLLVGTLA